MVEQVGKRASKKELYRMKITLSKSQWEEAGKIAGWTKTALINDDGIADGGDPYTNEEMDLMAKEDNTEDERVSFSYGTTPEDIIKARVLRQTPNGYPMTIRTQHEWTAIANAVNQGIDSHLEGFTRSKFDPKTGECLIHPEEMTTFLRRLYESNDEEAMGLRSAILETLGIEEI